VALAFEVARGDSYYKHGVMVILMLLEPDIQSPLAQTHHLKCLYDRYFYPQELIVLVIISPRCFGGFYARILLWQQKSVV